MEFINSFLGNPLGFLIYLAYQITGSYGGAVLIFAVVVKIVLFPINFMAHKNSIRFLKLQPTLNMLKRRYSEDKEELNEEQYQLFKKEKYNVFLGVVPLIIQIVLMMGMLQVMYRPLQHMFRFDQDVINILIDTYHSLFGPTNSSMAQLQVLQAVQYPANFALFQNALAGYYGMQPILDSLANTSLSFFGMDLGVVPSLTNITIEWLIPISAAIFSLVFCLVSIKISPGSMTNNWQSNLGTTVFTVLLSVYFAFIMPAGVGMYWAVGNLFGLVVVFIFELIYSPRKIVPEAIAYLKSKKKTGLELKEENAKKKELKIREKTDVARFSKAKKELVVYAIHGGQYKFYKNVIEYLLAHSDVVIHYLTNDPDDGVFNFASEKFIPYYASQRKTISLFLRLRTKILFTTVPDLQVYHMKRSIVQEDIEYIHIVHGIGTCHMAARPNAYTHFDTIFCVGSHQILEMQRQIQLDGLPPKNLVKAGYPVYDQLVESYNARSGVVNDRPQILIAPSWQKENILELCIDEIFDALVGKGYQLIVRPHIQFMMMFPDKIEEMLQKYAQYAETEEIIFNLDFATNEYIFTADLIMTDWSGVAYEFSYCSLQPSVYINTPMKVLNPNYERYSNDVMDITHRDKLGMSIDVDKIDSELADKVAYLLANKAEYKEKIRDIKDNHLFYPGRSGEAGAKYIINQLEKRR